MRKDSNRSDRKLPIPREVFDKRRAVEVIESASRYERNRVGRTNHHRSEKFIFSTSNERVS